MSVTITQTILQASLTATRHELRAGAGGAVPVGIAGLTRRLASQDEEAFREFHALYFDRLYQFLLVIARGQEHEAQEVLQETLLRVARHAREFDDEEKFWCWLKVVARNAARDGGRKRSRYFSLLERFSLRRDLIEKSDDHGAESRLETLLAECLAELSPEERDLVGGKYLDGASVAELATNTQQTEKAVESRLLRLRRHLRERLLKKLNES